MRNASSPYRYDRAAIRHVLETEGLESARARWPRGTVDPIARVMGLTKPYHTSTRQDIWNPAWTSLLGTKPDSTIAGELGLPVVSIRVARRKLGIPTFQRRLDVASRNSALEAIGDAELIDSTLDEIATKYGVNVLDVRALRRRRKVLVRDGRGRRVRVDAADLRRCAVLAIKEAYPSATLEEIGQVVRCTRERVRQIICYDQSAVAS